MSQQATRPPSFPQSRSSSRSKRRLESCWSPPDSPYGQQRHRGSLPGLPAFAGLVFRGRFPDRQLLVSGFPNLLVNVSGSHSWHGVWSYQLSDKVVAVCDRNCNVIAPFVSAPGNRNESPLLREALPQVRRIARTVGLALEGTTVSQDGVYDCRLNRKAIFNRQMVPNIDANRRGRRSTKRGGKPLFNAAIFKERFNTIERVFGWEDKFRRLLHRFERLSQLHDAFKTLAACRTCFVGATGSIWAHRCVAPPRLGDTQASSARLALHPKSTPSHPRIKSDRLLGPALQQRLEIGERLVRRLRDLVTTRHTPG